MYTYNVALSFAGEQRTYVETVNNALKGYGIKTFYDDDSKAYLWGKHLNEALLDIYGQKAECNRVDAKRLEVARDVLSSD
jgi:hypothetical protein